MRTWFIVFVVSTVIFFVTLVFPVGGLNGLATILINGSILGMALFAAREMNQ